MWHTFAMSTPIEVVHNAAASRFEARIEGHLCRADYRVDGGMMRIFHTEVAPSLEGRGIAAALVRAALDYAAANGLKVVPQCSYVRAYLRRHPEAQGLLAPDVSL